MSELREILQSAPREKLTEWAGTWEAAGRDRVPALAARLADAEAVARRITSLLPEEERLLRRLVAEEGGLPEKSAAAGRLAEIPLLFRARSPAGGRVLFLPTEMRDAFRAAFRRLDAEACRSSDAAAGRGAGQDRGDSFVREAIFLSEYAALHGIDLTQAEKVSQRAGLRLAGLLWGDAPGPGPGFEGILRRLSFAEALGLVARQGGALRGGPTRKAFLLAGADFQARALSRWAFASFGAGAADLFRLFASEGWLSVPPLLARRSGGSKGLRSRDEADLAVLAELGFAEISGAGTVQEAVRLSAFGHVAEGRRPARAERRFSLLPNGQILAPRSLAPDLAAGLFVWGERKRVDAMEEWALTRESVGRAIARGESLPDLLKILREAARDVPESLVTMIGEWAGEVLRMRTYDGTVLLVREEDDRAWVRERLVAAGMLIEEAVSGAFLLHPSAPEEIEEALGGTRASRILLREEEDEAGLAECERRLAALAPPSRRGNYRPVFR